MTRTSLRRQLLLPYVLLVIFVSVTIGWVAFRAGEDAVQSLSQRVLADMVQRIDTATEQHLSSALTTLHSIDPGLERSPIPQGSSADLALLESQLWLASGLFIGANNHLYFGGEDGRFIGVNRLDKDLGELYFRPSGSARRQIYAVKSPGDRTHLLRTDDYDPRTRPWYERAFLQTKPVWSPVYYDFASGAPTITLSKSVRRTDQTQLGVVAIDLTLKVLGDFLRTLNVSRNGLALVIDGEGYIVATSGEEQPFRTSDGAPSRMHVSELRTSLITDAYRSVTSWRSEVEAERSPLVLSKGSLNVAASKIGNRHGVDWITLVAIPRSDFLEGVTHSIIQGVLIAVLCVIIALILGLSAINRVLGDLRQLSDAARRIGDGEPLPKLNIRRRDEIGQLAMSFSEMEHNLRIDKLTAVFNRASLIAQIASLRRQLEQKGGERPTFALLFIDLDRFKSINDQYGHGAGDRVLVNVATRLKHSVRITDVVARYGGDEFVVLLKGVTTAADVIATEEKIRQVVEEPVQLEHGVAHVGVSIGWAMFPQDGEDVDALLKIADKRMFDTKKIRKAGRESAAA